MKLISQITALYLPGSGVTEVMIAIGTAFIFLKLSAVKFLEGRSVKARKEKFERESNIWAIE